MNSSCAQPRDFDDFAVRRGDQQAGVGGNPSQRIAEEVDDQTQGHARHDGGRPESGAGQQDHKRQQGPAHQLQFGQTPSGKVKPAAPAEGIGGRLPIAPAAVAAKLQIARVEDFMGGPGRVPFAKRGHAPHVAAAEMRKPPTSPTAPGQFDAIAPSTPRLNGDEIVRQRLRLGGRR